MKQFKTTINDEPVLVGKKHFLKKVNNKNTYKHH